MKIIFYADASTELGEINQWYEDQQLGLGHRFTEEIKISIGRIRNFPYIGSILIKDIRKIIIPNFPYGIIYSVTNDSIEIYAIAHLHRKPYYWKKRKPTA